MKVCIIIIIIIVHPCKESLYIIIIVPPYEESIFELHQACHGSIQTLLEKEAWLTHQQLDHQYSHTGAL